MSSHLRLHASLTLRAHLQSKHGMFKERQAVAIPVQEHSQIVIDICLSKVIRKLLEIQYRLRNLQAIGVDRTVRILSQAEFFSEKRNAIAVSWYGFDRLVQNIFVHVRSAGVTDGFVGSCPSSPCTFKNEK